MENINEIKVSVIVPVYNGEKYLARAVESILAQTMKDIEIILVDDGSEDGTADIIKSYKEKYPDLIVDVYNECNRSLGSARNIGVSHAQGEYIGFVDADDWIDPDFYEKMYGKAKETDADIVRCGLMRVNDKGEMWIHCLPPESWDAELNYENKKRIVSECFWGMPVCLFRRKTWIESGFRVIEETTYDEDMTSVLFILLSKRVAVLREPMYKYWINPVGTGSFNDSVYEKMLHAEKKIRCEAERLYLYEPYREELDFFFTKCALINAWGFMEDRNNYSTFPSERFCHVVKEFCEFMPEFMNNKYFEQKVNVRNQALFRIGRMGVAQVRYFRQHETELLEWNTHSLLDRYKNRRIAIWGAAQRGKSFLEKYDASAEIISNVIDKDERLHGERMPTGHLIVPYEECSDKLDSIFIMNHNYFDEIVSGVDNKYGIEFVDYEKAIYQVDEALTVMSGSV